MPLDPQAQAFLDQLAALNAPPISAVSIEQARQTIRMMMMAPGEPEPVADHGQGRLGRRERRDFRVSRHACQPRAGQCDGLGLDGGWSVGFLD
jgi:hypothetical protein